jgi:hypothetical protein
VTEIKDATQSCPGEHRGRSRGRSLDHQLVLASPVLAVTCHVASGPAACVATSPWYPASNSVYAGTSESSSQRLGSKMAKFLASRPVQISVVSATALLYLAMLYWAWTTGVVSGVLLTLLLLIVSIFWPDGLMKIARKLWIAVALIGGYLVGRFLFSNLDWPVWLRVAIAIPSILATLTFFLGIAWAVAEWQWAYAHKKWPNDQEARLRYYKSVKSIDIPR